MSAAKNNPEIYHRQFKAVLYPIALIVAVLIIASAINAFIFQSYSVEGASMQPTLHNNDRLVVSKTGVSFAQLQNQDFVPERGQIVIIRSHISSSKNKTSTTRLVKRVIGLPGESVVVADGKVKIFNAQWPGGKGVDEMLHLENLQPTFSQKPFQVTLDKDEIFVLGDNRAAGGSLDSRSFGAVSLKQIEGTLWARMLPLGDIKTF